MFFDTRLKFFGVGFNQVLKIKSKKHPKLTDKYKRPLLDTKAYFSEKVGCKWLVYCAKSGV